MKVILIITTFLISNLIWAQPDLDTIYANEHKNVALFFPNPIRQGIVGNDDFVFTYDREEQQYFGLLQARPGKEGNFLAITNDGQVYAYILKYSGQLPKFNYFIQESESIGNERPMPVRIEQNTRVKFSDTIKHNFHFYQKFCERLLASYRGDIVTKRKKGIKLQLQKMVYHGCDTYLVLEILNRSGIDLEIDYLKVYTVNGNKKRKASYQRLEQEIIYKYHLPLLVTRGHTQRFVYVLPKFVLGDNERLEIELKELNGHRKIALVR
ncbi:DUF4138 domain-containing protein [Flagellimonas algicola]|uniref:DUF4138 domain-containing protein n=1 Tax=Flagellimonas algicola TaxID=2583815 RepID=A0ABY2WGU3_9FLAO|nr:DUF4138 domain-containing protein [Allomuricauda algicola]TMU50780.1 DUF4138 domain-containing protein [Allomuricauda algicola]